MFESETVVNICFYNRFIYESRIKFGNLLRRII